MATRKKKRNTKDTETNKKVDKEKETKKETETDKEKDKKPKNKTQRNHPLKFQKTKLYKLFMVELEKLKGGDLAAVEKFMGGDWLDNLGIRKFGSLIVESLEVPFQIFGMAGIYLKSGIEAVWISKIYHWVKENVWENSFIRGFFDIFMKVGGKIGEAIYFIYILLTKIITDIMERKFRSVWLWVLTLITSLGVFDWAGSSGLLGSTVGSFVTGSVNGPIVGFFNTFNFWNFLGTIIAGIFSILGNIWGGITMIITSSIFFTSFFQVVLVIAVIWGLNTLRLEYNKSNPELIELSKPKKLRATAKNQPQKDVKLSKSVDEVEEKEKDKEKKTGPRRPSASDSSTKSESKPKKRTSRTSLKSIPEEVEDVEAKKKEAAAAAAHAVGAFNQPYKHAVKKEEPHDDKQTHKNTFFQNIRANFTKEGKVPKPDHPHGLKGGSSKYQNLSTKKLLEKLNKTSKSTIEQLKESNGMGFQMAVLCGFIKESQIGENREYKFTPQAAKTIKSLIISSHDSIHKNCSGDDCNENIGGTSKRTTRKNNEDIFDLDSIVETLKAFEFVQLATVHALVRQNNESVKGGNKGGNKGGINNKNKMGHKEDIQNVLDHLKKEDIQWLEEKDPEQIKTAIKLGILTPDYELTEAATGIAKDGDVINGISIKVQYEKYYSTVPQ
jgi:hypothetical protein